MRENGSICYCTRECPERKWLLSSEMTCGHVSVTKEDKVIRSSEMTSQSRSIRNVYLDGPIPYQN